MKFSELVIRIYDEDIEDIIDKRLEELEKEYNDNLKNQNYNKTKIYYDEDGTEIIDEDEDEILQIEKNDEFLKSQNRINEIKRIKNNLSREISLQDILNLPDEFDDTQFDLISYQFVDEDDNILEYNFNLMVGNETISDLKNLINNMRRYVNGGVYEVLNAVLEEIYTYSEYNITEFNDILDELDNYYLTDSLRDDIEEYLRCDDVPEELYDYFDFDEYENEMIDDYRYYNTSHGILVDTNH